MDSFLRKAWDAVAAKLGAAASFAESIAREIKVAINGNDIEHARRACEEWRIRRHEMTEALEAGDELVEHVEAAIADGDLSALEVAQAGLKVERLIDELEDVVTGEDEDDPPAPTT